MTLAWTVAESTGCAVEPAWAAAVLVMEPASMSAWLTVAVAVQVAAAPGARDATTGQSTETLSSVTVSGPSRVTLPLLVTTYSYEMTWPARSYVARSGVLVIVSPGDWTAGTSCDAVASTGWAAGPVPEAAAVFGTDPRSTSAWAVVSVARADRAPAGGKRRRQDGRAGQGREQRIGDRDAGEGDVPVVGGGDRVAEHVAGLREARLGRGLGQGEMRHLDGRDGDRVGRRSDLIAVEGGARGRRVRDRASVEVSLGRRRGGGAGHGSTGGDGRGGRTRDADLVVGDADRPRQRDVARVRDEVGIGDRGADGRVGRDVGGLDETDGGRL